MTTEADVIARTERLPARGPGRRGVMAFVPAPPETNALCTVAGALVISAGRATCTYRVEEFAADGGRGFLLVKLTAGTDAESEQYAVFCAHRRSPTCECKGFVRWDACKHADAVGVCLSKGWL